MTFKTGPLPPGIPPAAPGSAPQVPQSSPQVGHPPRYQTPPLAFAPPGRPSQGAPQHHSSQGPQHPSQVPQQQQQMQQQPPYPPAPNSSRLTVQYPQVGATLTSLRGEYIVQAIIGTGEFGAVYECVGPFDQVYAVKMIRPANRPYNEVHAEWQRELQRLMSLRHPNVVYIHDAFEQNHLFYLALERCEHPLTVMLGTPLQEGLVIELARQLLAAVQFLHDNDIVHDDLHPGNVLISSGTDRPVVKISDFGISQALRGASAVRPNVVHHKIMAPEVVASGYTSKQSDLYQVGLLLYWMLTGVPAIPPGIPYPELVRQVQSGEPRKRAGEIGTPLGDLIGRMLRRREAYRYTSAREVWADLRELPAWQNRDLFRAK